MSDILFVNNVKSDGKVDRAYCLLSEKVIPYYCTMFSGHADCKR